MRVLLTILMLVTLCSPITSFAEGQSKIDQNQQNELNTANKKTEGKSNRFELPNQSIIKNVKPIDLDKAAKKIEQKGEEAYRVLQAGSIPYFVVVLGISFLFLLFGMFIKSLFKLGMVGIFISMFSFIIINFAPEIAIGSLDYIRSIISE